MLKLSLRTKYILATIVEFIGAFLIALILHRVIEMLVIIPSLVIFRTQYTKTFHAETIWQCCTCTLVLILLLSLLSIPLSYSIGLSIILSYFAALVLYYIADYIYFKNIKAIKVALGMKKEVLLTKCHQYNLTDIETKVLVMFYCDKLKRWQIGNLLSYSEDMISKIKKRALDKFV